METALRAHGADVSVHVREGGKHIMSTSDYRVLVEWLAGLPAK
jgi:hypothetical protein